MARTSLMETVGTGEQLPDPERQGLYERAVVVCDAATEIGMDAAAVGALVTLAQQLDNARGCARYLLGGVLARLEEGSRWRATRSDLTFAEFCEQEVDLRYRTAKYLIDVYCAAVRLRLTPERLAAAGWTKAREFLRVATNETVDQWLSLAASSTCAQIRERVQLARASRTARLPGAEPADPLLALTVLVTSEQRTFIEYALEQVAASDLPRILSRGAALELICLEGLGNRLPREKGLTWLLAQIARVYGVNLQIVPDA
jgi:hypothetical protein